MTRAFHVAHRIKLYLDSGDLRAMEQAAEVDGFTTTRASHGRRG
jgi:hypothetical protein